MENRIRSRFGVLVTVLTALFSTFAQAKSILGTDQALGVGQQLASPSGRYVLMLQTVTVNPSVPYSHNLVLIDVTRGPLWSSGTGPIGPGTQIYPGFGGYGKTGDVLVMQDDGNLVLYGGGTFQWYSGSYGHQGQGAYLSLQDDGNLVVYTRSGQPLWSLMTGVIGHQVVGLVTEPPIALLDQINSGYGSPLVTTSFRAIALFSDGSQQDVTDMAVWASSNPGLAFNQGTGAAPNTFAGNRNRFLGDVEVVAQYGGFSAGSVLKLYQDMAYPFVGKPANHFKYPQSPHYQGLANQAAQLCAASGQALPSEWDFLSTPASINAVQAAFPSFTGAQTYLFMSEPNGQPSPLVFSSAQDAVASAITSPPHRGDDFTSPTGIITREIVSYGAVGLVFCGPGLNPIPSHSILQH